MTTVRLEAVGQLATFTADVFQWNKNIEYQLDPDPANPTAQNTDGSLKRKYDIAR